ncbi:MAG: hypothetical protein Q8M98_06910 [Candidatus Cloacimonadaceae bacterium]|nr:hypothetical protein [Candidatus Cloacimonadaceae bacterium]MDP3114490.1 hypothetical protein [Candidatus Cloacimonadaceae bacterium]
MSDKHRLRKTRESTVINTTSKKQETDLTKALERVLTDLRDKY